MRTSPITLLQGMVGEWKAVLVFYLCADFASFAEVGGFSSQVPQMLSRFNLKVSPTLQLEAFLPIWVSDIATRYNPKETRDL